MTSLWKNEPRARWFFAAHIQGSLGAAAGYVALLLLAYDRVGSAWGATAVLLADLLPAMLLGALLGALIDRTSRLAGAVAADAIRALAFAGMVLAPGTAALVACAVVAGFGTALFRPSTYALLPGIISAPRLGAATALFGAVRDSGQLLGPVLAAGLMLVASPAAVLGFNAATFAISALALTRLRGHVRTVAAPAEAGEPASLRSVLADRLSRTLLLTSGSVALCAATMNVGEVILSQQDLRAGATGFALLTTAYGLGLIYGALYAGSDGADVRRNYFIGIGGTALGMLATALAPDIYFALLTFAGTGAANGLFGASNRMLMHRSIPAAVHGRAFGLCDSLDAWGFGLAVIAGGALASAFGGRATFAFAGVALLGVFAAVAVALRERTARAVLV